jgi:hypothetical protein
MEGLLVDNFVQNPGAKLTITTGEIKQLTPDVEVTRGFAAVTPANGAAFSRPIDFGLDGLLLH